MKELNQVYIGVGSNINRKNNIKKALLKLKSQFSKFSISPMYESPSEGFNGTNFYNLVVYFKTELPLSKLQAYLKKLEDDSGRDRTQKKYSDRTLDLDILLFNDDILHAQGIDIPREEIFKYAFVLKPLNDLAPKLKHPQTGQTIAQIWKIFEKNNHNTVTQRSFNLI